MAKAIKDAKKIAKKTKKASSRYQIKSPRTPDADGFEVVEMNMDQEQIQRIDEIAQMAKVTFDQVITVILAIEFTKPQEHE